MKRTICSLALFGLLYGASALSSDAQELLVKKQFEDWKLKYGKTYGSVEEERERFENFVASIERVSFRKATATNDVFGLTKFADLSVEEFRNSYLNYKPKNRKGEDQFPPMERDPRGPRDGRQRPGQGPQGDNSEEGQGQEQEQENGRQRQQPRRNLRTTTPSSYDWRDYNAVTPVKDQGYCGSCWAHSAVETVESAWFLAGNTLTEFSVEQVVQCANLDAGCNGGDTTTAYDYIRKAGGLATAAAYPYTNATYYGTTGTCESSFTVSGGQISGYTWATPECTTHECNNQNENELAANLAATQPASICVYAESWQDYTSGVMAESDCKNTESSLDHCVQAVGYSDYTSSDGYWIVRNSWNTDWGVEGYIYLQFGTNTCGVADEATFVTVK